MVLLQANDEVTRIFYAYKRKGSGNDLDQVRPYKADIASLTTTTGHRGVLGGGILGNKFLVTCGYTGDGGGEPDGHCWCVEAMFRKIMYQKSTQAQLDTRV